MEVANFCAAMDTLIDQDEVSIAAQKFATSVLRTVWVVRQPESSGCRIIQADHFLLQWLYVPYPLVHNPSFELTAEQAELSSLVVIVNIRQGTSLLWSITGHNEICFSYKTFGLFSQINQCIVQVHGIYLDRAVCFSP